MRNIKSRIFANEVVDNTNPRAKADKTYVAAYIQLEDGTLVPALFTDGDIQKATKRATANKEDLPPPYVEDQPVVTPTQKSFWAKIFGL